MLPRNPAGIYDRDDVLSTLLPTAIYNGVFFQHGVSTYVWNKLFRRRKAARFVGEISDEIVMGEDAALTYPYLAACDRVVVCESNGYFYRQRSNSIVKSVPSLEREYQRLSILFRHLRHQLSGFDYSANVFHQLRYYFYAQVLVRSGAVVGPSDRSAVLIPFTNLSSARRIVVYSSGSFGQHVVSAIRQLNRYTLVAWIDEDDSESQRSGLPVSSIDSILALDFDLVLIAAIDSEYSETVASGLQSKGISEAKISRLSIDFDSLDAQLRSAGFDTESFSFSNRVG
jgi:hypothetical protein